MFGEAVKLANSAIEVASNIAKNNVQFFNLWKAVGDACSVLGHVKSSADAASLEPLSSLLQLSLGSELEILADVDKIPLEDAYMRRFSRTNELSMPVLETNTHKQWP
ncbi:Superkiller protein 3, partial [Exophiala xenobiotica]